MDRSATRVASGASPLPGRREAAVQASALSLSGEAHISVPVGLRTGGHTGGVLHRHPVLSLLTGGYLALVGWVTLSPNEPPAGTVSLLYRVLDALHRRGHLMSIDAADAEFLANVALFVPLGVFLLLLFGTRLWWLAVTASFAVTATIEYAQRSIPGRVPDERDLIANGLGAVVGVLIGLVLTMPAALRRRRGRRAAVATPVVAPR
jgi:VanZ family protein